MEDDWVVDSLIGFLETPLWRNPVDDFIEQHCIVFDQPEGDDPAYTEIHASYQSMVEELLDGFTTELGISWDQLSEACVKSRNLRREHRSLLQPLLASEQLDIFKKLMHKRNVDLERQALQLLQKQLGQNPSSYQGTSPEPRPMTTESLQAAREAKEEEMLQKALEMSMRDYEQKQQEEDEELQKLLTLAKQESLKMLFVDEKPGVDQENGNEDTQKPSEQKESDKLPSLVTKGSLTTVSGDDASPSADPKQSASIPLAKRTSGGLEPSDTGMSGEEAAQLWLQSARLETSDSASSNAPTTVQIPEDPIARENYLKRQRERLLESKKKARADELKVYKASGRLFASRTSWKPTDMSSFKTPQTGSYKKIADKGKEEGSMEKTKEGSAERPGKGGLIKRTGVLCTAIAKKMKADGTDL